MIQLDSTREKQKQTDYWVALGSCDLSPDQQALQQLQQRLQQALEDLGQIDYQLSATMARPRCDLTVDSHDNLYGQISQLVGPGIREAMGNLVDELDKARNLTEEVLLDNAQSK